MGSDVSRLPLESSCVVPKSGPKEKAATATKTRPAWGRVLALKPRAGISAEGSWRSLVQGGCAGKEPTGSAKECPHGPPATLEIQGLPFQGGEGPATLALCGLKEGPDPSPHQLLGHLFYESSHSCVLSGLRQTRALAGLGASDAERTARGAGRP